MYMDGAIPTDNRHQLDDMDVETFTYHCPAVSFMRRYTVSSPHSLSALSYDGYMQSVVGDEGEVKLPSPSLLKGSPPEPSLKPMTKPDIPSLC
jgi:hypothetical protein